MLINAVTACRDTTSTYDEGAEITPSCLATMDPTKSKMNQNAECFDHSMATFFCLQAIFSLLVDFMVLVLL
jgi:hypothetical protein